MAQPDTRAGEAERIRERLARLDTERAELEQRLAELACARLPVPEIARHRGQIANRSPTRDKIALFRSLFAGRENVYPRRWENAGKGTAGYAPVCANEWRRGAYHDTRGLTVTIDGGANRASVDKGADGTDTLVAIANPLSGAGFGIEGTSGDDVFNVNLADGQWMQASGGPGNDRFNIQGEPLRISYTWPSPRNGIDVDLAAGRANDDGFGDVDTFNGTVGEIRGTDLSDTIRGSDNGESFIGHRGNDVIDGRGGWDRLRFDRASVGDVKVDLGDGTASGIWGDGPFTHETPWFLESPAEHVVGNTFTYRVSNIEHVRSGNGDDELVGSRGDDDSRAEAATISSRVPRATTGSTAAAARTSSSSDPGTETTVSPTSSMETTPSS